MRSLLQSRSVLLFAFAFAVMGDPVSSVAYAVEAALRALGGNLVLLLPTMAIVLAIIALIAVNYNQLYVRFSRGGGDASAVGSAFGERWAFLPIGALTVDYALTIAISIAAGSSAVIAYLPGLAPFRIPLALALLLLVGGLTWFGHRGRVLFALMTLAFVGVASIVLLIGLVAPHGHGTAPLRPAGAHFGPVAVLLAYPVAMALATGVEAPSSAIAQLGALDDAGRIHFGRVTLWSMFAIVAWLTVALTVLAVRLRVGVPTGHETQMSQIGRTAVGNGPLFAGFQLTTAILLLAAASSSLQAGPGLMKALAKGSGGIGVLPRGLGRVNQHRTPYASVALFVAISGLLIVVADAREQELVIFYAVTVFVAFLCGLLAMARFFRRERRRLLLAVATIAALAVAVTLCVDLARLTPLVSLAAALAISGALYALWLSAGRPTGVAEAERLSETDEGDFLPDVSAESA
jgi:hypothetical protein